jgi:hypothetical protein
MLHSHPLPQDVEDHIRAQCNDFHWSAIVGANSTRKFTELVRIEFDQISPRPMVGGGTTTRYKDRKERVNGWHIFNASLSPFKKPAPNDKSLAEVQPSDSSTNPAASLSPFEKPAPNDKSLVEAQPADSSTSPVASSSSRKRHRADDDDENEIEYADGDTDDDGDAAHSE